jgi:hypothetical protein
MPTTIGRADRAHSSGNGPVEFSGTARARPGDIARMARIVRIAPSLVDLAPTALPVIGLGAPAASVVVQVLVPVCGPPM